MLSGVRVLLCVLLVACGRVQFDPQPAHSFLVVANGSVASVFELDTQTGTASPTAQGDVVVGDPNVIGATPDGRFIYMPNFKGMSLAGYAIDPHDGALTLLPGMPIATGRRLQAAQVTPSGRFLYVPTGAIPGSVLAYSVDAATGALAPLGEASSGGTGTYLPAVTPDGAFMYISSYTMTFPGFRIDATTGALTMLPGFPIAAQNSNLGTALDPKGTFLYLGSNSVDLRGYAIAADGSLTPVPGSPYSFRQGMDWLAVDPTGGYLLIGVANAGAGSKPGLYVWTRDRVTGAIAQTAASPFLIGETTSLTFSPDGRFVYATTRNGTAYALVQLAFDVVTGAVTQLASWPLTGFANSVILVQPQLAHAG